MDWDNEPASEQQLVLLRNVGYVLVKPLTRTEAARLIREYRRNPPQPVTAGPQRALSAAPPHSEPAPGVLTSPPADLSQSTRLKTHGLRAACEQTKQALTANPNAPNVRADAAAAGASRQEFWLDTCREVREMQVGSMQVFELYQIYGCRFFAPTREQVQEVLDALDSALPVWDREHPELFYQTLELNFPQLVKRVL